MTRHPNADGTRGFSVREIKYLQSLPAVEHVTRTRIEYTEGFKVDCLRRYMAGESPARIFRRAGLDSSLIGYKRIERCISRWKKMYQLDDTDRAAIQAAGSFDDTADAPSVPDRDANMLVPVNQDGAPRPNNQGVNTSGDASQIVNASAATVQDADALDAGEQDVSVPSSAIRRGNTLDDANQVADAPSNAGQSVNAHDAVNRDVNAPDAVAQNSRTLDVSGQHVSTVAQNVNSRGTARQDTSTPYPADQQSVSEAAYAADDMRAENDAQDKQTIAASSRDDADESHANAERNAQLATTSPHVDVEGSRAGTSEPYADSDKSNTAGELSNAANGNDNASSVADSLDDDAVNVRFTANSEAAAREYIPSRYDIPESERWVAPVNTTSRDADDIGIDEDALYSLPTIRSKRGSHNSDDIYQLIIMQQARRIDALEHEVAGLKSRLLHSESAQHSLAATSA